MALKGIPDVVLTLGNDQIWLGTPPVALQFILVFFHFVVGNCLCEKHSSSFLHWENDRTLLTICVFEILIFFWELK